MSLVLLRRVVRQKFTDVSEALDVSITRAISEDFEPPNVAKGSLATEVY
jgi:hypothetical protein